MLHFSSFKLLFPLPKASFFGSTFARSFFSNPKPPLLKKSHLPLPVLSSSDSRGRSNSGGGIRRRTSGRGRGQGSGGVLNQRRWASTLSEQRNQGKRPEMEEKKETLEFNKRRAEGRDKIDKPKNLQLKVRKLNPINTICYVQILGTGMDTQDTSPSVLLFFDKQRFIFNAGEGLQRFCTEHKIKLSKIDHIFFTRVCSETAGGLPGLLLTLAGIGEEGMSVNIWGSSDLNYLVDAMRSFIPNAAVVHAHSFGEKLKEETKVTSSEFDKFRDPITIIDDEVVRISAITLNPSYSNGSKLKPGDISVIYVCELPEIKGKFDPVKASALGLRPGPKYRELQLGNSVMSDQLDFMVHPSDVLGPSTPGPIILLVDCPTTSHLREVLSADSLNCYYCDLDQQSTANNKIVNCVIHLGPASVTKSADYQQWMTRFGNAQHVMAGHEMSNMEIPILKSSSRISSQLNYLCPQFFPAPGCWSSRQTDDLCLQSSGHCQDFSSTPCRSILAENLLKFHLRPYSQLGLDRSAIPAASSHEEFIAQLLAEAPEVVDISKNISQFWARPAKIKVLNAPKDSDCIMVEEPWLNESSSINNVHMERQGRDPSEGNILDLNDRCKNDTKNEHDIPPCLENIHREDMEIVLLGTGSSQPSKYRNVSSIFVNLFSKGSLLLDCGEGTLAQLKRRFGIKGADDAIKGLKCIWISHIHADHHTGLARILALRGQLLKDVAHKPMLVIGPRPLKRFLDAYSRLEDLDMQFLDCRHTLESSMNIFETSLGSSEGHSPENLDKDRVSSAAESVALHHFGSSLFAPNSKMQSYWKRPGGPLDTAAALPILMGLKELLSEAGLEALYSVPVVHCPQAFGVVLKAAERLNIMGKTIPGWKLVYSGDTRPCQALVDASRDATLLIHEATFEDSMEDEAIARNHSTTKEAVGVGTSADAYRVILTHFSQRYPKIPVFDEADMQKTCIAFDLMTVNLADLPVLPKFLPYLKVLFKKEMVADDESEEVDDSFAYAGTL
ncbi:tRNase Z TRZ3, mitochondrial-like [Zingiber officinale]|uniref:tRNase Z TRZ3, mitochondrial-like n=1 Tax=Zingiber officinale TaxID=94328 RepID=UPI001C4AD9F3|nr:tRNase Z TRZ3, mitochondrial-like [Zingiber officinale]